MKMNSKRASTKSKATNYQKLSLFLRFFLYGLFGITIDVFYFALLDTLLKWELDLVGRTNVLILPIYGVGLLVQEYLSSYLKHINVPLYIRGFIYTLMAYTFEFTTGYFLRMIGQDFWDYTDFSYNFKGIIMPHFAAAWYILGLVCECFIIDGVKRLALTSK